MNTEQVINVLLVDDRKEDLMALELILKNENYNFVKATSGREALRILLKEHDFAIILIDVNMPLLDGFETATLIRESERLKHIPIIFLTANNDAPANIFKGYLTGAVDYMIKPIIPEIIRAKISVFTDLYKKTNELQSQQKNLLSLNKVYDTLLKTQSEMGQGVLITEKEKIVYVNDAVCRIYGCSREEMLQMPSFMNALSSKDASYIVYELEQYAKGEKRHSSGETQIIRKDGKVRDIEYNAHNIEVEGKTQLLSIIRDITRKKQDEEKLRKQKERAESAEIAKRIGEQFLANMSHEIRTPMNAIIGFADVMLKTVLTSEQNQYIEAIKMSGDNLLVIVNDILDFSKIKSGKITIEEKPFKLSHIILTCSELMLPKASEKAIKLSVKIDENIQDDLIGDPTRLNQIVLNLTANAIKFTNSGEVAISVNLLSESENEVEIELAVSDTGIGIPEDKLVAIFEAFTQADNNTARTYGGTGLGLAIVKQLAELQNGNVAVSSEVGKGSCFYFRIRYKKSSVPFAGNSVQKNTAEKNEIRDLSILVVEDNDMNQLLIRKVLSDWGWTIDIVENGIEAVEKVRSKAFDIVLMDIQMPEMDGYEATRQIRGLPVPKCNIPIIAMTAHVMQTEEEKCYKVGMNGYVSKPFDPQTLYSKIVSMAGEKAGIAQ